MRSAIPGPNYTVQIRVTNEVTGGQGSHTLRYAGLRGPARASQKLLYGDIPVYHAIFTGGYAEGKAALGWTLDGGATAYLTVFRAGFTEEPTTVAVGSRAGVRLKSQRT